MSKIIVFPVTLDTKGEEAAYVKKEIEKKGHRVTVIDVGVIGHPALKADVTREEVASAGGKILKQMVEAAEKGADRAEGTNTMIKGIQKIVKELYIQHKLDGIISVGGGTGTFIGAAAMSVLPIGIPKLMVSTILDPKAIGTKDITVMQTPADMTGLNGILRKSLAVAAGAISGMVEAEVAEETRPIIAMTALGVTTPAVMKIKAIMDKTKYDSLVIHSKTDTLDELIEEGKIKGLLDLTTHELFWPIEFCNPSEPMMEGRLESAGKKGIPQIIVPGGLDMVIMPPPKESWPEKYQNRPYHAHNPFAILIRTSKEEIEQAAKILSERANRATGPVSIIVPKRGFSSVDKEGQHLYNAEIDQVFIQIIRKLVNNNIEVIEVDAHINDDEFARVVANKMINMIK